MPCPVTPVTCRFPTMRPPNGGFHHATAFRMRMCSSAPRPAPRGFAAIFRINLINNFITEPLLQGGGTPVWPALDVKYRQLIADSHAQSSDIGNSCLDPGHGVTKRNPLAARGFSPAVEYYALLIL
jgi:hypothetical protein